MADERKHLIDEWVDCPEGTIPEKIHILFDANTREFADQYASALHVSRNIPFNTGTITVADPLVMVVANLFKIKDGNTAMRQAIQYYEKWTYEALKHSWVLALLEDNDFSNVPTPYDSIKTARGLPQIPEPDYSLANPVEFRLKQIFDIMSTDLSFQHRIMSTINNAIAEVVQEVEERDKNGFQSGTVGGDVHVETSPDDNNNGNRPVKRRKDKTQGNSVDAVGEVTETPVGE